MMIGPNNGINKLVEKGPQAIVMKFSVSLDVMVSFI